MNRVNVLLTSVGRNISLLRYFRRALKSNGIIVATDVNKYAPALFKADYAYIVAPYKSREYLKSIVGICKKHKIALLIPGNDDELLILAKYRKRIESLGVMVMVSNFKAIEICSDKLKFIKFCAKNNFETAELITRRGIEEKTIKFPLFINERFGRGSRTTFKVNNMNQLEFYLKMFKKPIVQQYIDANEYSVDLFADFNGKVVSAIPRLRLSTLAGESVLGVTENKKNLISECIRLAKTLKMIGHINIQCFLDSGKVKFTEINPRFGGGSSLSIEAGCDSPRFLVQLARGKKVKNIVGKFKTNLLMTRYIESIFAQKGKVKWDDLK